MFGGWGSTIKALGVRMFKTSGFRNWDMGALATPQNIYRVHTGILRIVLPVELCKLQVVI